MSGLRIAIDASPAGASLGGVSRYTTELLKALPHVGGPAALEIHPLAYPFRIRFGARKRPIDRLHILLRDALWYPFGLSMAGRIRRYDTMHMTTLMGPILSAGPLILTIHDLSVLHFPKQFPRWFRIYTGAMLPLVSRRAAHIITDSEFSKSDIHEMFGVPLDRISVIPLGLDHLQFRPVDRDRARAILSEKYGITAPYFLTVGVISPRKNLSRLVQALIMIRASLPAAHLLLIVGEVGWHSQDLMDTIRSSGMADAVRLLGHVPDGDLSSIYSGAEALVYPSLFEGFGLPILEAMACGCPVIGSSASSIPEVIGDAGLICNPKETESIAHQMRRILHEPELSARLRAEGIRRASGFDWRRTAELTVDVYRRVASVN